MIDVSEIVADADLQAPKVFTILRSTGQFVSGGFASTTRAITAFGPVQRATSKEIQMLPEADRVGAVMSFWWTQPIYLTSGSSAEPSTHGEVPSVVVAGTVYLLSAAPPLNAFKLYLNGTLLRDGVDYSVGGLAITLQQPIGPDDYLYATWPVVVYMGLGASDVVEYDDGNGVEQYRVLDVKHYPGSGYWKAMGTRMSGM